MSSSGEVLPSGFPMRLAKVTWAPVIVPLLARSKVPDPFIRLPCHVTSARRSALAMISPIHLFSRVVCAPECYQSQYQPPLLVRYETRLGSLARARIKAVARPVGGLDKGRITVGVYLVPEVADVAVDPGSNVVEGVVPHSGEDLPHRRHAGDRKPPAERAGLGDLLRLPTHRFRRGGSIVAARPTVAGPSVSGGLLDLAAIDRLFLFVRLYRFALGDDAVEQE